MSKTKISEFSTTPGDNTDINGINIAEGCAPSGINNAIRQMMADLKEWQSGSMDVYVVPAGTAAAPGIQVYGDLDTGIYSPAAGQIGISINGNSIGYFDSTGWVGGATIDTTNIEVTNIKAKDGTAAMSIADSTGAVTVTTVFTLSTTGNIALGTSQTTGNFTIGGISQTGAITIGQSTKGHTFSVASGSTESGATKTINIGTNGVSLSTTLITIGSAFGTTITLNGTVTAATFNSTTIDTTNIEVTNIKAKDGTASASIADSTGVMTIASSILTTTDINGGTIDGATIATSDITVGAGKTLNVSAGTLTLADDQISGDKIQGGTIGSTTITTLTSTTVNASTVDTTNIEVTNVKAKDGTSAFSISDTTGAVNVGSALTASGVVTFLATTQNIALGTSQTSGTFTVGGASQTGAITVDQSTKTHTLNVASGATENAATKTVNVATGGVSGSTTTITIGSENGTSTTVNGATSLNASDGSALFVGNSTASTSGSSYLTFKNKDGPGVYRNVARVSGKTTDNGGNGEMLFETYASGVAYKGLKIDNLSGVSMYDTSGNVKLYWDSSNVRLGINKASPSTTLDVDGTISGTTVDTTNLEVTNVKAKDGTAAMSIADSTGAVTVSTAFAANANVTLGDASTDTVQVNGYMGVGGAASTNRAVSVVNTALSGTTQSGVVSNITGTSGSTSAINGLAAEVGTAAAAFTVADLSGLVVQNASKGAGSTITNQHGVKIADQTQGTNNYGITSLVSSGTDKWNIYASGTAANYFAGNVGIGVASPGVKLDIKQSGTNWYGGARIVRSNNDNQRLALGNTSGASWIGSIDAAGGTNNALLFGRSTDGTTFSESARFTSGGDLLVGVTTNKVTQFGGAATGVTIGSATYPVLALWDSADASYNFMLAQDGGTAYVFNNANGPLTFSTNATERARITSGGVFQVSSGGSVQVGGTAARATTAGTNRLDIFNGTAPVGTLTNGISIYSSSGEAYVMDAAGNATLFSPHDAETNEWIFKSKHTPTGKVLKIDVERLLRFVNDHFGLDAVQEFIES